MEHTPLDKNEVRENFAHFLEIPTRWIDNNQYARVNNAHYHSLFEMLIMHSLEVVVGLDLNIAPVKPVTVENHCRYHRAVRFPDVLEAGLRVASMGKSSLRYEMGLFIVGQEAVAATGHNVNVYVEAASMRPAPIPETVRSVLATLMVDNSELVA